MPLTINLVGLGLRDHLSLVQGSERIAEAATAPPSHVATTGETANAQQTFLPFSRLGSFASRLADSAAPSGSAIHLNSKHIAFRSAQA